MSILDRLWKRKAVQVTAVKEGDSTAQVAKFIGGGDVSASGKMVTDQSALTIATAWSCIRILAETIGSIPWGLYKRDASGNITRDTDHPVSQVLVSPNQDMTNTEYREAQMMGLCLRGNAYSLIGRSGPTVVSLTPIQSDIVQPMRKDKGNTRLTIPEGEPFYRITDRGKQEDYPRDKIWHVKGFGQNGLVGLSPLGAARETFGLALATADFGAKFFTNGGMPSGTVTVPGWLDPKQRQEARDMLNQMLGGLGNAHRFALFEGGLKPEPWGGMTLEDMQFLLVRNYSVAEICRFYRVPPHMVADLSRATFSNIEQQSLDFVQYTLLPYFTRFESSLQKWLLTPEERSTYFLRFNFEGMLRGDSAARAAFYNSALQNGWMNRNEVRAKENLNRVEGLDEYTVQTSMTLFDQLARMATSGQAAMAKSVEQMVALVKHAQPEVRVPVTVHSPPVTVNANIQRGGSMRLVPEGRDGDGNITSVRSEEITH